MADIECGQCFVNGRVNCLLHSPAADQRHEDNALLLRLLWRHHLELRDEDSDEDGCNCVLWNNGIGKRYFIGTEEFGLPILTDELRGRLEESVR